MIIHYAFLDIIIGGYNMKDGIGQIPDGIDVAKDLIDSNPDVKVLFYSGCSVDSESQEFKKCKSSLNKDINNMIIMKNNDLLEKKMQLVKFLSRGTRA